MSITIKVKLRPFTVPSHVIHDASPAPRQDGFMERAKSALKDIDEETLAALCEEFTKNVFEKAGKQLPKR